MTISWKKLLDDEAGDDFGKLDAADQLDVVCDVFERLWKEGHNPRLEECVAALPQQVDGDRIRRELIPLEFDYRVANGTTPSFAEFFGRFPESPLFVARFFCHPDINSKQAEPLECIGDKYWLLHKVGAGSSGVVYRGFDAHVQRFVAVKLPVVSGGDGYDLDHFELEGKNAGSLSGDPGIVSVHEVNVDEHGRPYIISDFVEGKSLSQHLKAGTEFTPKQVALVVAQIAETIDYAHRRQIVHRDLKPGNIMLVPRDDLAPGEAEKSGWQPKVLDFGLAKRQDGSMKTVFGAVLGTPAYMSPEQAKGEGVDRRADVYSLGAILYRMLYGHGCFERPNEQENTITAMLWRIVNEDLKLPREARGSGVDRDLRTICLKALAKEREKRYASAAALADDLRKWCANEPIEARPQPWYEKCQRWVRRHAESCTAIGLGLALVVVMASNQWRTMRIEARRVADEQVASVVATAFSDPAASIAKARSYRSSHEFLAAVDDRIGDLGISPTERFVLSVALLPRRSFRVTDLLKAAKDVSSDVLPILAPYIGKNIALDQDEIQVLHQTVNERHQAVDDAGALLASAILVQLPRESWPAWDGEKMIRSLSTQKIKDMEAWGRALELIADKPQLRDAAKAVYMDLSDRNQASALITGVFPRDLEMALFGLTHAQSTDAKAILAAYDDDDNLLELIRKTIQTQVLPVWDPLTYPEQLSLEGQQRQQQQVAEYINLLLAGMSMDREGFAPLALAAFSDVRDPRPETAFIQQAAYFLSMEDQIQLVDLWAEDASAADGMYCAILAMSLNAKDSELPIDDSPLQDRLQRVYQSHPDSGVHGACAYALAKLFDVRIIADLGRTAEFREVRPDRNWYHNHVGAPMIVIRKGTYSVINYEVKRDETPPGPTLVDIEIKDDFGIAATELTFSEYNYVIGPTNEMIIGPANTPVGFSDVASVKYLPAKKREHRVSIVDFLRAANVKSGYGEYACFPPEGEGQVLVCTLDGAGYRLPTRPEWHVACCAMTTTPWSFGTLATPSRGFLQDVTLSQCPGVLAYMPNRLGFFGTYVGLYDATVSSYYNESETPEIVFVNAGKSEGLQLGVLCGGHFAHPPKEPWLFRNPWLMDPSGAARDRVLATRLHETLNLKQGDDDEQLTSSRPIAQ